MTRSPFTPKNHQATAVVVDGDAAPQARAKKVARPNVALLKSVAAANENGNALRAGAMPFRVVSPLRRLAREEDVISFATAVAPFSDRVLAEHLGLSTDRQAAQARVGALPLVAGEIARNLPLDAGFQHLLTLMRQRVVRELGAEGLDGGDAVRLRVGLSNIDTLIAVLAQRG